MDLHPEKCNLCGGKVIYTTNARIYGKKYGSGYCYLCTLCGAYVGTHKHRPKEALGLLSNREMRVLKCKCHEIFDKQWNNRPTLQQRRAARQIAYKNLAKSLKIPVAECHFGWFDKTMLQKAYQLLLMQTLLEDHFSTDNTIGIAKETDVSNGKI